MHQHGGQADGPDPIELRGLLLRVCAGIPLASTEDAALLRAWAAKQSGQALAMVLWLVMLSGTALVGIVTSSAVVMVGALVVGVIGLPSLARYRLAHLVRSHPPPVGGPTVLPSVSPGLRLLGFVDVPRYWRQHLLLVLVAALTFVAAVTYWPGGLLALLALVVVADRLALKVNVDLTRDLMAAAAGGGTSERRTTAWPPSRRTGLVWLVAGTLITGIGLSDVVRAEVRTEGLIAHGVATQGQVAGFQRTAAGLRISVSYVARGQERETGFYYTDDSAAVRTGDHITIYVDPHDPHLTAATDLDSQSTARTSADIGALILGLVAVIFALAILLARPDKGVHLPTR